jgi:hypothetical protein
VKHYVLTRSHYGQAWSHEANERRLDITRAVTATLMAAQTNRDWTWVVALDPADPLLEERMAVFAAAAPKFVPLLWSLPGRPVEAPWAKHSKPGTTVQRIASTVYRAPWRSVMASGVKVLQTRLDDDDGLAPDAIARYQRAGGHLLKRTILMLPSGIRVNRGRYADVIHNSNAMHTLVTPAAECGTVYDYGHATCRRAAPVKVVDHDWGWVWTRHQDTISGWKMADAPITRRVRDAFPVDWDALEAAWAAHAR